MFPTDNFSANPKEQLKELTEICQNAELTTKERYQYFTTQIGNPYSFLVNGTIVNIAFSNTEKTLSDNLKNYFTQKNKEDVEIL